MGGWEKYFSLLRCLNCKGELSLSNARDERYPLTEQKLVCGSCNQAYPVSSGIPIMFKDSLRTRVLLNPDEYKSSLKKAEEELRQIASLGLDVLARRTENPADALGYEILFWERWKQNDEGFIEYDAEKIRNFLETTEGKDISRLFHKAIAVEKERPKKLILNIGAGRDFLLEKFLEEDFEIIEQDVVLEPLIYLKKRGASFCVCSDVRHLPFADDTFNLTVSFSVLHHIYPIEDSVKELLRVTRGNIIANEPNSYSLTRAARILPNPLKRTLRRWNSFNSSTSPYEKSINPRTLCKIIGDLGGEVVNLSFTKSSLIWNSNAVMILLKTIHSFLNNIVPMLSSTFNLIFKKKRVKGNL